MTLSAAIISTLKYSDHFDFPLTAVEICLRLVGVNSSKLCSQELVFKTLRSMIISKQIQKTNNFYHLRGRSSLAPLRRRNLEISQPMLSRAKSLAGSLAIIPGVLSIYLTGSLSMSNSTPNSDIDFMIITRPGRLWTTRLLLTIYTSLLGYRRTPGSKQNTGKLCLNLYLTPQTYLLPSSKRSLYTAYELIQTVPLYDPEDTHSALITSNSWIRGYLPNFPLPSPPFQIFSKTSVWSFWDLIESFAYYLQLSYMHKKITHEYVTKDSAFFHPHNPAPEL